MSDLYVSRLYYPEGVAPFGELNIINSNHGQKEHKTDTVLTVMEPHILREAWGNSTWLSKAIGQDKAEAFTENEKLSRSISIALQNTLIKAAYFPHECSTWFAVRPPGKDVADYEKSYGLAQFIMGSQVVGFANGKHDVSGNAFQRQWKKMFHPEKIYAAVSNVNVSTTEQHKYIGSALLHTNLRMFEPEQRPTIYIAAANTGLISKLAELTYVPTGSRLRDNLVEGAQIEEVRLQGESVQKVRDILEDKHPWLNEAIVPPEAV